MQRQHENAASAAEVVVAWTYLFAVVLLGATDAHASRLGEGVVGVHSRRLMGVLAVSRGVSWGDMGTQSSGAGWPSPISLQGLSETTVS